MNSSPPIFFFNEREEIMSKRRKIAGSLSALLLITSLPTPLFAAQEFESKPIFAEREEAEHSNVLQRQVANTLRETSLEDRSGEVDAEEDVLEDETLRAVINRSLSDYEHTRPDDQKVTKADLAGLKEIDFPAYKPGDVISSLKGLEHAEIITKLSLYYTGTDLSPLKNLTSLEELEIRGRKYEENSKQTELTDITPLSNLTNVIRLVIDNTKVSNLEPLTKLTQLNKVSLQNNEITTEDLKAMLKFPVIYKPKDTEKKFPQQRTYLWLDGNKIDDGRVVKEVDSRFNAEASKQRWSIKPESEIFENPLIDGNENRIELKNDYLKAISPSEDPKVNYTNQKYKIVGEIKDLKELEVEAKGSYISGTLTIDLSALNKKPAGEEEVISDPALRKCINRQLDHPLDQAVTNEDLQSEDLISIISTDDDENIRSLQGLEKATNLTYIDIYYTGNDLSPIKNLNNLRELTLRPKAGSQEKLQLDSLKDLSALNNLTDLTINNAEIKDLSALTKLKNIYVLNLENDNLEAKDLAVFDEMGGLANGEKRTLLNLKGNKIQDISSYQYKSFRKTTIDKQKIRITPEEKTFDNPIKHIKKGETEVMPVKLYIPKGKNSFIPEGDPGNHLKQIKSTSENKLKDFEKYEIVGELDGLSSFDAEFNSLGFPNTFNGTLTIDLSKIHQKAQESKELEKSKKEAKETIENLKELSQEEKTDYKNQVDQAQDKGAVDQILIQAKDKAKEHKKEEERTVTVHVTAYEGKTFIEKLYQAKVEITDKDGIPAEKVGETDMLWKLSPGNYHVKVSYPGFKTIEEDISLDAATEDLYYKLQQEVSSSADENHQYSQPSIQKIQLVELGNPEKPLAEGTFNGNLITFAVENAADRERIFNDKATIKILESTNVHAYETGSYICPSRFKKGYDFHPTSGDLKELTTGESRDPIVFNPDGLTSLAVKGKGGKVTEYFMFVKEKSAQHVVVFQAASDQSKRTGMIDLKYKGEISQAGKMCQELVQVVDHNQPFVEPFKWVADTTDLTASWGGHDLGKFLGWYDELVGGKKYDETTPITEDTILNARFSRSTMPTDYQNPFTVWIPGNVDVFKAPLKVFWSVNESNFNELTKPEDVKVRKGDTLNLKIDDTDSPWKLSGMEARYGTLKLPIIKDDQGIYHFTPVPSHDNTDLYPDNDIYLSWVKKEDAGNQAFDINKQHNIHLLQEGTLVEFTNISDIADYRTDHNLLSKFQEGHTIRFKVIGEEITEVEAQNQAGQAVEVREDSKTTDERTGLITGNYHFVMPADDVDLIVKGTYQKKLPLRRIDFKFKDSQGKEVAKDQIKSLTITGGGETYTFDDLSKDTNIPVSNLGYTYFYTVVTEDGVLYQGKFTKTAKELGDSYTIELKAENPGKEKTKEDFESLVTTAEGLIKDSSYTQESRDKLQAALTSAKHQGNLQAYTAACKIITDAMSGLKKADTLPDKEKAKESLEGLIRRLSNLKKADYESKAWDAFDKEMDKAKAVLKDANSSEDALNSARTALAQAKVELDRYKIVPEDMTKAEKNLRDLIRTIERLEEKNYSKETWKDLKYALDQAKDELNYSKRTEWSLERAYDKLNKAYKDLKLADKLAEEAEKINQDHKVLVRNSSYQNMTDIKSHWARDFIKYCMDRGYLVGTSITSFSPDRPTTRAEFVTVLSRLAGIKEENYKKNKFTDVPKGVYYEAAVNWAQDKKIVEGTGSNKFAPDQTMTREEMATILDRYFQATNKAYGNRGALYFKDQGEMSTWAADSVKRMTQAGILHGTDRNTFEPKSSFTRAELATVIYQLNR